MKKKTKQEATLEGPLTKARIKQLGNMLAEAIHQIIKYGELRAFDLKKSIETVHAVMNLRDKAHEVLQEEQQRFRRQVEDTKQHLAELAKNGGKAVKSIVKELKTWSADPLISLSDFLKRLPKHVCCNHIYDRIVAEANRRWSSPSFIVGNVVNRVKQELVSRQAKAYKAIAAAVKKANDKFKKGNRPLSLDGVVSVRDGEHYIAFVCGGNNGRSNWKAYLQRLTVVLNECKHSWIVELENDCLDDTHYALIGFRV